ncbi:MAG: PE-PGRS family protein [Mycobacterium sp.]
MRTTKLTLALAAGAIASVLGTAPIATAVPFLPADPGGGGCFNGQCGSGGVNGGPGGGPGGLGCVPTAQGVVCGSGGVNAGPGGVPGGSGCFPGLGCGSGHG